MRSTERFVKTQQELFMIKMSEENEEFFDAVESLDNEAKTANDKIEPVEERWDRMMVQSVVLADLL